MSIQVYRCLLIAGFAAVLLGPLLWLGNEEHSVYENRALTQVPKFSGRLSQLHEFVVDWEMYFNDQYGFRERAALFNDELWNALRLSALPNVVEGNDGWLFFTGQEGDRPLDDYSGKTALSKSELESWARVLTERKEKLESAGIDYLFMLVPNKAEIYGDKLPSRFAKRSGMSRCEQLVDYLQSNTNVPVLYMKEAIAAGRYEAEDFGPFDRGGTHWNAYGAALGMNALGEQLASLYEGLETTRFERGEFRLEDERVDRDLARMLAREADYPELGPKLTRALPSYRIQNLDAVEHGLAKIRAFVRIDYESTSERRAFIFGDSFFDGLIDYLGLYFESCLFAYRMPTTQEIEVAARRFDLDIIIEQRIERYLFKAPESE